MKRNNIEKCRSLRRKQTDIERALWSILRNSQLQGVKFRRQFPVGKYILDFYSPAHKLGIEADGGQHYEEEGRKRDVIRAEEILKEGIRIIRFSDRDILRNIEGVCEVILHEIEKSPSPQSSPQRVEEVRRFGR